MLNKPGPPPRPSPRSPPPSSRSPTPSSRSPPPSSRSLPPGPPPRPNPRSLPPGPRRPRRPRSRSSRARPARRRTDRAPSELRRASPWPAKRHRQQRASRRRREHHADSSRPHTRIRRVVADQITRHLRIPSGGPLAASPGMVASGQVQRVRNPSSGRRTVCRHPARWT